jgi:hypothetical protein
MYAAARVITCGGAHGELRPTPLRRLDAGETIEFGNPLLRHDLRAIGILPNEIERPCAVRFSGEVWPRLPRIVNGDPRRRSVFGRKQRRGDLRDKTVVGDGL